MILRNRNEIFNHPRLMWRPRPSPHNGNNNNDNEGRLHRDEILIVPLPHSVDMRVGTMHAMLRRLLLHMENKIGNRLNVNLKNSCT